MARLPLARGAEDRFSAISGPAGCALGRGPRVRPDKTKKDKAALKRSSLVFFGFVTARGGHRACIFAFL